MVSFQDVLTLSDRLRAAHGDAERTAAEQELRLAVESEVRDLFEDPKYDHGRRSFGTIRKRIAIFDDSSEDFSQGRLRQILFGMGARVHRGEGDEALWELSAAREPMIRPVRWKWRRPALAVIGSVVAALLAAEAWERWTGEPAYRALGGIVASVLGSGDRAECVARSNGVWMEIVECNARF